MVTPFTLCVSESGRKLFSTVNVHSGSVVVVVLVTGTVVVVVVITDVVVITVVVVGRTVVVVGRTVVVMDVVPPPPLVVVVVVTRFAGYAIFIPLVSFATVTVTAVALSKSRLLLYHTSSHSV